MNANAIMDVIVAAVLLLFLLGGARRGLFRSIAGLVIMVMSLVGAGMFTNTVTPMLSDYLQPVIERQVEQRMESAMSGQSVAEEQPTVGETDTPALENEEIRQLLVLLGLDGELGDNLANAAEEKVREAGISIATAVAQSVAASVLHALVFLASFVALLLLLNVLMRAMDLVLKLPGLHLLNTLGGAAVGLAEGALVLFLAIWVLRRLGFSPDEAAQSTVLLRFFTTNTPLSVLSFL